MERWDESRLDELDQLRKLILEISRIDHATGCLARIQECIDLATRLGKTEWKQPFRKSFISFLEDVAQYRPRASVPGTAPTAPEKA